MIMTDHLVMQAVSNPLTEPRGRGCVRLYTLSVVGATLADLHVHHYGVRYTTTSRVLAPSRARR